jgi:uncharacterized membrane protein HdeD (DUF308 family)
MPPASPSREARTGQWILGCFTLLLGLIPALSLIAALFGNDKVDIWKDFLFPIGYLAALYMVWNGEPWFRYLTAALYVSKGIPILFGISMVIGGVVANTPREQMGAGWQVFSTIILPLLSLYLAFAVLYWAFAAVLLFSRRVRRFLAYQYVTGSGPLTSLKRWVDWIVRMLSRRDEIDLGELGAPSIRRPVLTIDAIYAIEKCDLTQAVFDLIAAKQELHGHDHSVEFLSTLNSGMQMVLATWWLEAEVRNGGFHQFFWNKSVSMGFAAAEGYRLIGAKEQFALTLRAIEAWMQEEPQQDEYRTTDLAKLLENYASAREQSSLDDLDTEFYALSGAENLRNAYIRNHPQEFVADFSRT